MLGDHVCWDVVYPMCKCSSGMWLELLMLLKIHIPIGGMYRLVTVLCLLVWILIMCSSVLCVLMLEDMFWLLNVMLCLMQVITLPFSFLNTSVRI